MCGSDTCWLRCSLCMWSDHFCSSRITSDIIHQQHSHSILQMTLLRLLCCMLCRSAEIFSLHWVLLSLRAFQWSVWQLQVTELCSSVLCTEQREWWWWWQKWSEQQRSSLCETALLISNSREEDWEHKQQCQKSHCLVMICMRAFLCLCNLSICTHLVFRVVNGTQTSSVSLCDVWDK